MSSQIKANSQTLYNQDYNQWVELTIKQLQERNFDGVDWENVIEKIADLSRREKSKLKSFLTELWEYALKLKYWEFERTYNQFDWKAQIRSFRKQIKDILQNSPSLKSYLQDIWEECYNDALQTFLGCSQLPLESLSIKPIATIEQILDETWLPSIVKS